MRTAGREQQIEWIVKITTQALKVGINNPANKNLGTDRQIWRRMKRFCRMVFENLLASVTVFQTSVLLFVTFEHRY